MRVDGFAFVAAEGTLGGGVASSAEVIAPPRATVMSKARESIEQVIERLHREACEKGRKAYRDPVTKMRVCTAEFLLSRRICCNCECRHCPFPAFGKAGQATPGPGSIGAPASSLS